VARRRPGRRPPTAPLRRLHQHPARAPPRADPIPARNRELSRPPVRPGTPRRTVRPQPPNRPAPPERLADLTRTGTAAGDHRRTARGRRLRRPRIRHASVQLRRRGRLLRPAAGRAPPPPPARNWLHPIQSAPVSGAGTSDTTGRSPVRQMQQPHKTEPDQIRNDSRTTPCACSPDPAQPPMTSSTDNVCAERLLAAAAGRRTALAQSPCTWSNGSGPMEQHSGPLGITGSLNTGLASPPRLQCARGRTHSPDGITRTTCSGGRLGGQVYWPPGRNQGEPVHAGSNRATGRAVIRRRRSPVRDRPAAARSASMADRRSTTRTAPGPVRRSERRSSCSID